MSFLKAFDTWFFLVLNGLHNTFFDFVMYWASNKLIWIPVYALFLYWIIRFYGKKTWVILFFAALLILLSDQLSVQLFKNLFHRLRPCHDVDLVPFVHLVNGKCGGQYGFISSHACNLFALATFLTALLGAKIRFFKPVIFTWAAFISYSRIYLGVHYPGDVFVGALTGIVIGLFVIFLYRTIMNRRNKGKETKDNGQEVNLPDPKESGRVSQRASGQ